METLEGQWRAALDKSKHKKKQVRQLQDELQVTPAGAPTSGNLLYLTYSAFRIEASIKNYC